MFARESLDEDRLPTEIATNAGRDIRAGSIISGTGWAARRYLGPGQSCRVSSGGAELREQ